MIFTEIAKFDTFDIPNGIQLFDPVEEEISKNTQIIDADIEENSTEKSAKSNENQAGASASTIPPLNYEFYDDINITQIPHLDNQRRDIADDLAQLYADDPAQAPAMEEAPTPDADSSHSPKPNVFIESDSAEEDLGPRRLRGTKARKTVRFPDMAAFITAW